MKLPPIRLLDLSGSPEAMGRAHGLAYGEQIRDYTRERIELVTGGAWSGGAIEQSQVLSIAQGMLAEHEAFSSPLHDEMLAMAEAAEITPAEAIVVGGFTDFIDTVRAEVGGDVPPTAQEDDCTSVIVPDHKANGQGFFAQTWDMHDTATKHVVMMRLSPQNGPKALVFTTGGALGQIGMNEHGVCIGINNLTATDGCRGVTWPNVVREALNQDSAESALAVVLGANLAGGHNFHIFDAAGSGYSVEAMPTTRTVETLDTDIGGPTIVRTNHALADSSLAVQGKRDPGMQANSQQRLATGRKLSDRDGITTDDLMELTRESGSICQVAAEPFHVETSGAAVMRPSTKQFWACWGKPSMNDYQRIDFP